MSGVPTVPAGNCVGRLTRTEQKQRETEAREGDEFASRVLLDQTRGWSHVTSDLTQARGSQRSQRPGESQIRELQRPVFSGPGAPETPGCLLIYRSLHLNRKARILQKAPWTMLLLTTSGCLPRLSGREAGQGPETSAARLLTVTFTQTGMLHLQPATLKNGEGLEEQIQHAGLVIPGQWEATSFCKRVSVLNYQ